ncbi:TonB-dependent receptor [Tenacibaculum aiptasiae]|uniref:TonB-dependent receptor n=1 Tax=Tenacibaculum aiptasiae TaxID=426481 RepID=A0A7J5A749_9FLAO|nr:TonB-dependent receptor [Tenacibaculum aiptasiae]KAB1153391.1 TonB-dependent receptor [Tenacibaculum aiptasiae]
MKQLITICCALLAQQIFAQTLKGKIVSQENIPITEAHILNLSENEKHHTHSNERGVFILHHVTVGDTLEISHINYKRKKIVVNDLKPITITLEENFVSLEEVTIGKKLNALNVLTAVDIQTNPVNSSQEILQKVPGLFIGQHAGGGKAEQIFLRGFDIDHGTDITITADGMPVNMVSHAHGQGYADLHFVIPETVDKIDFGKGAYYADKGNFNTAGYVNFKTKNRLASNIIKLEVGQYNSQRLLGMFSLLNNNKESAYIASEYILTDGYFDSPQNFHRLNVFGKYTNNVTDTDKVGFTVSHFTSKWDASGQVPQRAINSGLITRFGAIDDTEGGTTSRTNLLVTYDKVISETSSIKNKLFYNKYNFELFSNFTFFLDDPVNGDQIKQKETRNIFGFTSDYTQDFNNIDGNFTAGISLRNDRSFNNELSHTANRSQTLNQIQLGDINETNMGVYAGANFNFGKFTINPALRLDYFNFEYNDALQTNYKTQSETQSILSPKLNIFYNYNSDLQLYLKTGKGFHSNDTRVVVAQKGNTILPASYGFDAGFIWKPTPKLLINMAYWYLFLEQEFVYVGDAGIVEPSGKTQRQGVDLSLRYEPVNQLYFNLDANYSHARATEEASGQDYIPLAPDFTLTSGLTYKSKSGIYGGVQLKHINDRPANEDNSIVAEGYTVTDLNVGYQFKNVTLGLQVQNLFDVAWNEAQFATESRLQNEANPVEEIHFTPGTPFFLRGSITVNF